MAEESSKRQLAIREGGAFVRHYGAHIDRADNLAKELASESDRAAAVLGAAYLDDLLGEILRERLDTSDLDLTKAEKNRMSALWSPSGPLGSFSTRIAFALLMELLP